MALLKDLTVYGASRFIGDVLSSQIYGDGFHHNAHNTNTYVLLAGGGAKALDTLATNDHNHNDSIAQTVWGQKYVNANGILTSVSGDMSNVGNIIPSKSTTYTLGSSQNRWASVYIGDDDTYGSAIQPIYWNNGVPTSCTVSINGGTVNTIAYYSSDNVISSYTNTVGSNVKPIYLNSGIPETLGSVGGPATAAYLYNGEIVKLNANRGGLVQPVWLRDGEIIEIVESVGSELQFAYLDGGKISATKKSLGSPSKPVYLNNGVFTECSNMATSSHTHKIKLGGTEITIPSPGTTSIPVTSEINGPFNIITTNGEQYGDGSKAFSISRNKKPNNNEYTEIVKHYVDDAEYHIDYTNDETSSSIHWKLVNTDSEQNTNNEYGHGDYANEFNAYLTSRGAFRPGTSYTGSIGTPKYYWNNIYGKYIYSDNIYGDLTGKIYVENNSNDASYPLVFTESNANNGTYSLYKNYSNVLYNPYKESLVIGTNSIASGLHSFAHGSAVRATYQYSHAEGNSTLASGDTSHAEGYNTLAQGGFSHAEGNSTQAKGDTSHTEGFETIAEGSFAHAEGQTTKALGDDSHSEGFGSHAIGKFAHAEGSSTRANGNASHTSGEWTIANNNFEAAFGVWNQSNPNTMFSVGGGTQNNRLNLFEITNSGTIKFNQNNGYVNSNGHIYSPGFHHTGLNSNQSNYVLTADGGYKEWSDWSSITKPGSTIVCRQSNGDIHGHYFNSNISDENTITVGSVYVRNNSDNCIRRMSLNKFTELINDGIRNNDTITFNIMFNNPNNLITEAWMDTGIRTGDPNDTGDYIINKGNGTYAVQISHGTLPPSAVGTIKTGADSWPAIYSGIMSIYTGETNGSLTDEVILHRSGHAAGKRLYLRIVQLTNNPKRCKIEIAAESNFEANASLTFKFRKLI